MKKFISIILTLSLSLVLFGCGKQISIDKDLDDYIHTCIMERNDSAYLKADDGYSNEAHNILGAKKSFDKVIIYAWVLYREWGKQDNEVVEISGGYIPTVFTIELCKNGSYNLIEYWEPRDGAFYLKDIKSKFPLDMRTKLGTGEQSISDLFDITRLDAEEYYSLDKAQANS